MAAIPNIVYLRPAGFLWLLWFVTWMAAALWTRSSVSAAPRSAFRAQLVTAGAGFALLFGMPYGLRAPSWQFGSLIGWGLVALTGVGFAFAWWARLHLGPLWSGGVERREGHRIVDTGPYALVRHPIYTGLILSGLAFAALRATPLPILGAALIALGFGLKAKVEERFLAAEFGDAAYAAYRRRVPMLVPFMPTSG